MARIPVPRLPFSKWNSVSMFLQEDEMGMAYSTHGKQDNCIQKKNTTG
jgi:hypothetical protein